MVYKKVGEFKTFSPVPTAGSQLVGRVLIKFIVWGAIPSGGMSQGVPDMKADVHFIENSGVQERTFSREDFKINFGIDLVDCQ
jgi:hypothetical protein